MANINKNVIAIAFLSTFAIAIDKSSLFKHFNRNSAAIAAVEALAAVDGDAAGKTAIVMPESAGGGSSASRQCPD